MKRSALPLVRGVYGRVRRWRRPWKGASLAEHVAAIAVAIVSHDPFDHDAVASEPGERPFQKSRGGFLALVRQNFVVGEPAGIVDADMPAIRPSFLVSRCSSSPGR